MKKYKSVKKPNISEIELMWKIQVIIYHKNTKRAQRKQSQIGQNYYKIYFECQCSKSL